MFDATANESEPPTTTATTTTTVQWSQLCRHFEFDEILSATEHFNDSLEIGRGSFGRVYRGNIYNGSTLVVAAIKRLDSMSNQGESEFWAEVEMLSKLRHCHLVSLIGYCNHETEMILVYEYMPRGTLEGHLHKLGTPLSWCERLKICIGAARGLEYLHTSTDTESGVIHRDVKCSNILLDKRWAAKVSDFGFSKITPTNQPSSSHVSTLIKGTFGYFDPHYFSTGRLSRRSDVYSFGVVLLEVLCRKSPLDSSFELGMATWAQDSIKAGHLMDMVDSDIRSEISRKCLKKFVKIIDICLDYNPKNRPTMDEVVRRLKKVLTLQERTTNGENIGMDFRSLVPKMPHIDMDFRSLVPKMPHKDMDFRSLVPKMPHIDMDFRSLMPNMLHVRMEFGSLMHKKKKKLLMLRESYFQEYGSSMSLEDKLKNGVGSIKIFRAKELKKATMDFAEDMIIGKGGYGSVYKGVLRDNHVIAIKRPRIYDEAQLKQFINEIIILGQINHRNVVQLLGCCLETEVPMLVYEFVSNGNLHDHIHNNASIRGRLSWDDRLRIAHESAGALAYLHSDATMTIIHRDVKAANILLDENYTSKLADFGASQLVPLGHEQISTIVVGTLGYLDHEYLHTGQLTNKSDVYSFGVVLAELLTGLKAVDYERRQEDRFLALYFVKAKRENRLLKIVDCQVLEEAVDEQLEEVCYLVCRCLDMRGENRPSMKEVTMELERIRKFSKRPLFTQDKSSIKVAMELERRRKLSMHSWGSQYNDDGTSSFMSESEQDGLYDNLSAYNDTFSM